MTQDGITTLVRTYYQPPLSFLRLFSVMTDHVPPFAFGYPTPKKFSDDEARLVLYRHPDRVDKLGLYLNSRTNWITIVDQAHTPNRWGTPELVAHRNALQASAKLIVHWFSVCNILMYETPVKEFDDAHAPPKYAWCPSVNLSTMCGYRDTHADSDFYDSTDPRLETIMVLWTHVLSTMNCYHLRIESARKANAEMSAFVTIQDDSKDQLQNAVAKLSLIERTLHTWNARPIPNYGRRNVPAELDLHVIQCIKYYLMTTLANQIAVRFTYNEFGINRFVESSIPRMHREFNEGCVTIGIVSRSIHALATRGLMFCHRATSSPATKWPPDLRPHGCAVAYVRHALTLMRALAVLRAYALHAMSLCCVGQNQCDVYNTHALLSLGYYVLRTVALLKDTASTGAVGCYRPVDDSDTISRMFDVIEYNLELDRQYEITRPTPLEVTRSMASINQIMPILPPKSPVSFIEALKKATWLYSL